MRQHILAGISVVILLILLGSAVLYFKPAMINVPYFGFYTHNADLQGSPTGAAIVSLLAYYGIESSKGDLIALRTRFPNSDLTTVDEIISYLNERGLDTEVLRITNVVQLKRYFNALNKKPIIVLQSPSLDYRGNFHLFRVVTGVDTGRRLIFVHDYYAGPNVVLPLDSFLKLSKRKLAPNYQGLAISIRGDTERRAVPVPALRQPPEIIKRLSPLLEEEIWAFESSLDARYVDAFSAISAVITNPDFSLLPKANRAYAYGLQGLALTRIGKPEEALTNLQQSVTMNSELDKPDGAWQGYDYSAYPEASFYLGEAYQLLDNKKAAVAAYQQALKANPSYVPAKDALLKLE